MFTMSSIFESTTSSPDRDWKLNSRLHVREKDWDARAEGFRRAASMIVDAARTDPTAIIDYLVYPVAFLYRHYLELRIKELLIAASSLHGVPRPNMHTHDINRLWLALRPYLDGDDPPQHIVSITEKIEAVVSSFSDVDPNSEAFRYPESRGVETLPGLRMVNLGELQKSVDEVAYHLDGASVGFYEHLQAQGEMNAEWDAERAQMYAEMANEYYEPPEAQ